MVKSPSASAFMPKKSILVRRKWKYTYGYALLFALLSLAYILLTLIPTPLKVTLQHYHLSHGGYYWIIAPVVVYIVCVWAAGLFGSLVFKSYANLIKKTDEGRHLNIISNGLLIFTVSQPLISSLAALAGLIDRHHPQLIPTFTIINNYISIALMLLAFFVIALGTERLSGLVSKSRGRLDRVWVSAFIAVSSLYSYFIVIQPIHTPADRRVYFLPNWLLVVTIAIPYLIVWYTGLNAAAQIYQYQRNVRGLIYKSALRYLALGIALVIASSVLTRIITTISARLTQLSLTPLLIIIYALILVDGAGFILIAIGAKKLRKIEEV